MPNWVTMGSGVQTATIDTEHTLATVSKVGRYRLSVDFHNLATNNTPTPAEPEVVQIRHTMKMYTSDSHQQVLPTYYMVSGLLVTSIVQFPIVDVPGESELKFLLKQITPGTGRDFRWNIIQEISGRQGAVATDGGNGPSTFKTNLTGFGTDAFRSQWLAFLSGGNTDLARRITVYNTTTGFFTVAEAFPNTPSNGDVFVIIHT